MSRIKYKGPFFQTDLMKNQTWIKIYNKSLIILPEYINHSVSIYNGKNFINLEIDNKKIGFKFGEFINTRKKNILKKKKKKYGSKNNTNKFKIK
jgi:small subunit ribosomal protein S19